MTAPVVTVAPDSSVAAAMATMTDRRIRHLPVVVDGELIGLVSIGDLVKRRIEDAEAEASASRTISPSLDGKISGGAQKGLPACRPGPR